MKEIDIFHFEDEPHRCSYASMIQSSFRHRGATSCSLRSNTSETEHVIEFVLQGAPYRVVYRQPDHVIGTSDDLLRGAILHIVDYSIGSDRRRGAVIFEKLVSIGVPVSKIWMLTAYAYAVRQSFGSTSAMPRIIDKPPRHDEVAREIVRLIGGAAKIGGLDG